MQTHKVDNYQTEGSESDREFLRHNVQANLGRPIKYANQKRKNWSLYLFFRILDEPETRRFFKALKEEFDEAFIASLMEDPKRLEELLHHQSLEPTHRHENASQEDPNDKKKGPLTTYLQFPQFVSDPDEPAESPDPQAAPAELFLSWLSSVLSGSAKPLIDQLATHLSKSDETPKSSTGFDANNGLSLIHNGASAALSKGLAATLLYDTLRQLFANTEKPGISDVGGVLRSESTQESLLRQDQKNKEKESAFVSKSVDRSPINIGFTSTGLLAAGVNDLLVKTFPDAFQEGMAARANRLFDTGPSAPENWVGELGHRSIHGVINTGFAADDLTLGQWDRLRGDVEAFNNHSSDDDARRQRRIISILFRLLGMELLHIELGEEPALNGDAAPDAPPEYSEHRLEHFGFRDGLSQPFVDMGLGRPGPGGEVPSRRGSWEPVAPGEIYLGFKDQDGHLINQPAHPQLRNSGTYMVFRKLEQDVVGFRHFLRKTYPSDTDAQKKLAAQIMGRWQNGTSLVQAPDEPLEVTDYELNDFRYKQDDPQGEKCPLGAHVRRSNPRDIGDGDSVKRHRILRRSIAYGGPILREGSADTTQKKGMLFIAMNARIDLQFELIQARWINGGEFLGQSGLAKCPLLGAHDGKSSDSFYEAGALSPVRRLPRFVTTRGGDYFFMPGLSALQGIAQGAFRAWRPESEVKEPFRGYTMSQFDTPELFSAERVTALSRAILDPSTEPYRVMEMPSLVPASALSHADPSGKNITLFGHHDDVATILAKVTGTDEPLLFSTEHYLAAGKQLTRGDIVLLGTDPKSATAEARKTMSCMLEMAWRDLNSKTYHGVDMRKVVDSVVCSSSEKALVQYAPSGRIDLVQDLAVDAAYTLIEQLYGVRGPDALTEIAISLPFAKTRVGEVHPDWLAAISGVEADRPDVTTVQIWSIVSFIALVADLQKQAELSWLARKAGSELLDHIDLIIARAKSTRSETKPRHLIDSFINVSSSFVGSGLAQEEYYRYVRVLIAELVVSTMALLPTTFASIMQASLRNRIDLPNLVDLLKGYEPENPDPYSDLYPGLTRFIYEMNRVEPSLPVLLRRCVENTDLAGASLKKGDWVGALIAAANFDRTTFPNPEVFSLAPILPGPERDLKNYLMFGGAASEHGCWGRDKIVLASLARLLITTSKIKALRSVAGPASEPSKILNMTVGLTGVFPPFKFEQWDGGA